MAKGQKSVTLRENTYLRAKETSAFVPDTFVDYEEDKATEKDLQWILGYKRRRWLSKKRRAMFDPEQQQLVEY